MAAYLRPNVSIRKTDAYELDKVLLRRAPHFLLMTATPRKGDPDNKRVGGRPPPGRQALALRRAVGRRDDVADPESIRQVAAPGA